MNFGCPQPETIPVAAANFANVPSVALKPGRGRSTSRNSTDSPGKKTGRDRSYSQNRRGNSLDKKPRSRKRSKDHKPRERSKDQKRSESRSKSKFR